MSRSVPQWIPPEKSVPDFALMSYFILSLFAIVALPIMAWYLFNVDDRIVYYSYTQECFTQGIHIPCTEDVMMRAIVIPE